MWLFGQYILEFVLYQKLGLFLISLSLIVVVFLLFLYVLDCRKERKELRSLGLLSKKGKRNKKRPKRLVVDNTWNCSKCDLCRRNGNGFFRCGVDPSIEIFDPSATSGCPEGKGSLNPEKSHHAKTPIGAHGGFCFLNIKILLIYNHVYKNF